MGSSRQRTRGGGTNPSEKSPAGTILYICTTFPRLSETFVEREVRHLNQKLPLQVVSLWKGSAVSGIPVRTIPFRTLFTLFGLIPLWLLRNPSSLLGLLQAFFRRFPQSRLNLAETLLGMGMGIILAERFLKTPPSWIHAIWATAPATCAWTLHKLTGASFSFGAHAYDLFQDGGDCLLPEKIASASWIRTSTKASAQELTRRHAPADKIVLVRRGLPNLPPKQEPRPATGTLTLLAIGRLVAKKGYPDFLRLCCTLLERKIPFEATIVGDGPLRKTLQQDIQNQNLAREVRLTGALPRESIDPLFSQADLFVFTGVISKDGDRDGLPNVIPEAMAHGLPVVVRPASGVLEAVTDGVTGRVLSGNAPHNWADQIYALWQNVNERKALSSQGRQWVEENFLSATNTAKLEDKLRSSSQASIQHLQP